MISAIQKIRLLLSREEKKKWLGIVGFALCTSLLEVVTASVVVIFAQVLNQPEIGQKYFRKLGLEINPSPGKTIFYISVAFGIIYLVKNLIAAFEGFYQNLTIQKMNYHFKNKILHQYAETDYAFYLTRNSSLGVSVVAGDVEQMFSNGLLPLATILSESIVFFSLIAMIVAMNPFLAVIFFGVGGIFALIVIKGLFPLFYRWGQRLQESSLLSSQNLLQFFHGFKEIVLLGKRDAFIDAYKMHSYKRTRVQAMQTATNNLPRMVIEVLFVGLFMIAISCLCLDHETPSQMIGILGGYLYVGFRLMPGLNRVISQLNTLKMAIPSINRVYDEYHSVEAKENYLSIPEFKFKKSITLSNVDFRYVNTNKDALHHITLEIKKGDCIGIVGETGSGKSTLVDLILGLLKPTQGSILVDNKYPVNSYEWHKHIGYVPQSIYLTDDSIESNIAFGEKIENIDESRLNKAIEDAQLSKFINQLPEGIKTIVGERGIRLSGGERQRISIARALYRNPDVLIFDEATSALDNETEAKLMETIHSVSKNRTVIMIAHRLTTLKDCNQIYCFQEGHLINESADSKKN